MTPKELIKMCTTDRGEYDCYYLEGLMGNWGT